MFSSAIVSIALAASALANVYITSPTASTTFTAGQQATISWEDNGQSPSLLQFGNATISIYVGNAIQQTPLQTISTNVNVSSTSSLVFTPQGTIGPNSNEYFIRVQSNSLMDPAQPQYPELAFSAKFTMAGMTGTFNSSVQAEINGQSTAPIGAPSSASASAPSSMSMVAKTTAAPTTTTSSTGSPSPSANAAGRPGITGLAGFVGAAAALIGAALL
ncbi:hypothetical protein HYDPIDRAFT_175306 [Hydnomerulius pinastri MD-312]|uniref:Yeast cell wall synthesis Kre9/Knh1-like N-terminal domain-containing protein n=1 Tax=Hydnomerulius pinastri MD-312 TaxID=994086 RepID=A0A0C9WFF6_9AGAM|nr:hypothetical protein HYDPIDRAFT_175306 [Hydnomerulius pinastri MD-312]